MSELKPCRVCNVQPEYRHYGEQCWNECPNCECKTWPMSDSYEEADDAWNKLQTPELPEGYYVREEHGVFELWSFNHCLATFTHGMFFFNSVYTKDASAVIAFLQGAR